MSQPTPKAEQSQAVQRIISDAGLSAVVRELPDFTRTAAEAAAALGCEVGAIGNSLLFLSDGEPLLIVTSGRHRVDTERVAAQLAVTRLEMAPAKLVRSITGQVIGGVAPVGHPAPLRTVIDAGLREYETVWTAAGTLHSVVPLRFDELVALTHGTVLQVASD